MVPALKHKALQEKGWRQAPALQRNKSTSSFRTVAAYRQRSRRHHSHAVRSLTLAQARQDREAVLRLDPGSLGVLGALHASMLFRSALRLPRSRSVPRSELSPFSRPLAVVRFQERRDQQNCKENWFHASLEPVRQTNLFFSYQINIVSVSNGVGGTRDGIQLSTIR